MLQVSCRVCVCVRSLVLCAHCYRAALLVGFLVKRRSGEQRKLDVFSARFSFFIVEFVLLILSVLYGVAADNRFG